MAAGVAEREKTFYIGIDMGTTHIKTAVFSGTGVQKILVRRHTPIAEDAYATIYRPEEFWEIVSEELNECLNSIPADCFAAGIAVTGMAEAGLMIDRRTGREVSPILPWFDKRTEGLAAQLTGEEETEAFLETGLRNSFKYGIYKFLWLLEETGMEREHAVWLSVCDYIVYRLTGKMVTDPSFAARTYLYDISRGCFRKDALLKYGLTEQNFPEVLPSGMAAGSVKAAGIHTGGRTIAAAVAGHDHICAAFAVQRGDSARICNSAGTAETYVGTEPARRLTEEDRKSGLIIGPYVDGINHFRLANISSSGQSVEWFRRNLQLQEISYDRVNKAVSETGRTPSGILYYPYLSGMGTPLFDPGICGGFLGLKADHTYGDLLKAIMEGLGYQSRYILKNILRRDSILVCVGGAAQSASWMQIKANILGRKILVPAVTEATLLGAAALYARRNDGEEAEQALTADVFSNAEQYAPDAETAAAYEKEYSRFLKGMQIIRDI